MATQQTSIDIQSRVMELAGDAFTAFCDDMSAMFSLQASAVVRLAESKILPV